MSNLRFLDLSTAFIRRHYHDADTPGHFDIRGKEILSDPRNAGMTANERKLRTDSCLQNVRKSPSPAGANLSSPSSPARRSSLARVAIIGGTSGKRTVSLHLPIRLRTVFTGAGFDSQKLASNRLL